MFKSAGIDESTYDQATKDAQIEEQAKLAWESFVPIDANGDGKVTKQEFIDFL